MSSSNAAAAPAVSTYHPYMQTGINHSLCLARRTNDDTAQDRRWKPIVYSAYQCKNAPVSGTHLCQTCTRHKTAYDKKHTSDGTEWHGLVTDTAEFETLPADSHIAGSKWFHTKAKWNSDPRPMTAKQEGRLDKAPRVPSKELARFAAGKCELDLETLVQKNQITTEDLRDILTMITNSRVPDHFSRAKLIENIRHYHPIPVPVKPVEDNRVGTLLKRLVTSNKRIAELEALLAAREAQLAAIRSALGPV
jgi:hypothetical protein